VRGPRPFGRAADWAELLRISAAFTVPGDAVAGAAAAGHRPNRGTLLAAGASLCLYEAGMALNDFSDREIDAVERPGRPLPSGRIAPGAALAASVVLTAAGLRLAAAAGRPALLTATALAGTVWAYDLRLKHTAFGPAAMAAARALDLVLGATATTSAAAVPAHGSPTGRGPAQVGGPPAGAAAPAAGGAAVPFRPGRGRGAPPEPFVEAAVPAPPAYSSSSASAVRQRFLPLPASRDAPGSATFASSAPSRPVPGSGASAAMVRRAGPAVPPGSGGPPARPARSLEVVRSAALLGAHTFAVTAVSRRETLGASSAVPLTALGAVAAVACGTGRPGRPGRAGRPGRVPAAFALAYATAASRPLTHAALNPSPPLLQRAVGGGIRATIPLQAALAARAARPGPAVALLALLPLARRLSRKVSPT